MSSFIDNKSLAAVIAASALTLGAMTPAVVPTASATPAQSITWEACPSEVNEQGATCGRIDVPMNYSDPGGKKISVGFVKLPAKNTDKRRGSLFVNPGGPGGSVYDLFDTTADRKTIWPGHTREEWDIIGVQPRGLKGSTPLDCNVSTELFQQDVTNIGYNVQAQCDASNPGYAKTVNTENTAEDWNQVRQALGEDKISLYGMSYGTFLSSVYATAYPQHTDKVVLDAGYAPDWDFSDQIQGRNDAFNDFFAWAAKHDDVYHMGTTPRAVYNTWSARVVAESGTNPTVPPPPAQTSDVPDALGSTGQFGVDAMNATGAASVATQGLFSQLTHPGANQQNSPSLQLAASYVGTPQKWPELAAALASPEPVTMPSQEEDASRPGMAVTLMVFCGDRKWPIQADHAAAALWAQAVTGDVHAQPHLIASGIGCNGIEPQRPARQISGAQLATKPLQIQGTRDSQAPYWNFEKMSTAMQSHVLTVDGPGHTQGLDGNTALSEAIDQYLRTGKTDVTRVPGIDPQPE